jgi:hypothetical protein
MGQLREKEGEKDNEAQKGMLMNRETKLDIHIVFVPIITTGETITCDSPLPL